VFRAQLWMSDTSALERSNFFPHPAPAGGRRVPSVCRGVIAARPIAGASRWAQDPSTRRYGQ
jgi:hypothetical protein